MKKQKNLIQFKSEKDEFEFWSKHNSLDYIDKKNIWRGKFPNLKLTSRVLPIRLPLAMIDCAKIRAHKVGIPYQTLLKLFIAKELGYLESGVKP